MSRYNSGKFAYGYDNPLMEYFLQENKGKRTVEHVGSLSGTQGTAGNLLEAIKKLGVEVPNDHLLKIQMDLPF
jgi:hypothetical protein